MFEKKLKLGIKKVMIFLLADMVVMAVMERYLFLRERQNRWNVTWNASPSAFRVSGKKNEGAKKRRK